MSAAWLQLKKAAESNSLEWWLWARREAQTKEGVGGELIVSHDGVVKFAIRLILRCKIQLWVSVQPLNTLHHCGEEVNS